LVNQRKIFDLTFRDLGFEATWAHVEQQLPEADIVSQISNFDGWILGDDPCTRRVIEAGQSGSLKAIVKWGVGTDNIDFEAIEHLKMDFANTPGMFGNEVADVAMGYVIMLSRDLIRIHNEVTKGGWPKPAGKSLSKKIMGIVGFGDIGSNIATRAIAAGMKVIAFDTDKKRHLSNSNIEFRNWPSGINQVDYLILSCPLNMNSYQLVNSEIFSQMKRGSFLVNISRGGLIDEGALLSALEDQILAGAALDVYVREPLPISSPLLLKENVIFGSHNASNTIEAVRLTSEKTIELMANFLKKTPQIKGI
jgi:D-3-phosphoglycerate dehydrogenase